MTQYSSPQRLSVVINNYNYGQYVGECIQSVLDQSRTADEIIIVDDGSTDNSVEIVGEFEKSVKLLRQPNGGQLSAVMTGVAAATGDILLFLDSDDIWKPNHLEIVEKAFVKHPSVGCLFTRLELFGNDEGPHPLNTIGYPNRIKCSRIIAYYLRYFFGRPTSACAFRSEVVRNVLEACKGLEDDFRICADMLIIHGTSLIGAEKLFIDDYTVRYRTHGVNGYYKSDKEDGYNDQALALRLHRRSLVIQKIRSAYPFDVTHDAVVKEMTYNGNANLYFVFYRKIPDHMNLSYLRNKILRWRLRRLKRKQLKMNGRMKIQP
jgi:glycosyltransferase involved in cell wall biosynthesis